MSWFGKRKKRLKVVKLKPGQKLLVICKHKRRHFE